MKTPIAPTPVVFGIIAIIIIIAKRHPQIHSAYCRHSLPFRLIKNRAERKKENNEIKSFWWLKDKNFSNSKEVKAHGLAGWDEWMARWESDDKESLSNYCDNRFFTVDYVNLCWATSPIAERRDGSARPPPAVLLLEQTTSWCKLSELDTTAARMPKPWMNLYSNVELINNFSILIINGWPSPWLFPSFSALFFDRLWRGFFID